MGNRINSIHIEGDGENKPPKNIPDIIALIRREWELGKKAPAIGAICDCMALLSKGIARLLNDNKEKDEARLAWEKKQQERLDDYQRRLDYLEARVK